MIAVTGAYGFIGSCLISRLQQAGVGEIVAVDDFSDAAPAKTAGMHAFPKSKNLENKAGLIRVERDAFFDYLEKNREQIHFIFHLGARTDTAERDYAVFERLNVLYTKKLWEACARFSIPLIYASSAATYGAGALGYGDQDHTLPDRLKPLNPYGASKNDVDRWVLAQTAAPPFWAGLKFFNVYGPNEYHKGRMASVIFHFHRQILETGKVCLFKSHRPDYRDGSQQRDFIYVKDVVEVLFHLYTQKSAVPSGIYNVGSGKARSFNDLADALFKTLSREPMIEYIDIPLDIRDSYQYFTEADMDKLKSASAYPNEFRSLELGIQEYISGYLTAFTYY